MLSEEKYESLVKEIEKNRGLDESDRLLFYELHKKVNNSNDFILYGVLIDNLLNHDLRFNDRFILIEKEEREIASFLEKRRHTDLGLTRHEYNYLTYLNSKFDLKYELNSPCYPKIVKVEIDEFKALVCFNTFRSDLYITLIKGLRKCGELYKLEKFDVLIGGSFIDTEALNPGDIDLIVLLPLKVFRGDFKNNILNSIIRVFKDTDGSNLFDLLKLPDGSDRGLYMNYELLTLIGNKPASKSEDSIKINTFKCRDIFKLTVQLADL